MLKRIKELLNRRSRKASSAAPADGAAQAEAAPPKVQVGPRAVHRPIPRSDLDPDAVKIVHRLTRFDHSAYLVGGCVRDLLLDQRPKDFDIGTSATPRQIKRLFRNSRIIGRRFRLAHIYFQQGKIIEVATFRSRNGEDGEDAGSDLLIREDNQFGTPEEDALRRDFTVNALFYDVNRETVLDHADGLGDLRRRLIRTIGDPAVRFREDPIRILRAIKFAARLDFEIEAKTLEALQRTRHEIPKAAAPRILEEINRFCRGGAARRSFELMRRHGVFEIILPEISRAYADRDDAWKLLGALMDEIDRRQREGQEVPTGAIFAALLLPALRDELGWSGEGEKQAVKGLDVRALVDPILRPLAVRLRVSRKDQETCRQLVLTLFRMVPARKARRNTRRSILRRECLPDALWILGTLGRELGGEFPAAHQHWVRAAESAPTSPPAERGRRKKEPEADSAQPEPAPAGPKRKRRSRGRRDADKEGKETRRAPSKPKEGGKEMPPPWDDDYFFAALPSVPSMKNDDGQGDRYGAAAVAPTPEPEGEEAAPEAAGEAKRSKRRRRPRRRRRRPSGGSEKNGGDGGSAD